MRRKTLKRSDWNFIFADTNNKVPRNAQLDQNAVQIHQTDLDETCLTFKLLTHTPDAHLITFMG